MPPIRYDIGVRPEEFVALGQRVWRRVVAAAPRGRLFLGARPDAVEYFDRIGCERRLTGFVAKHPLPGALRSADERYSALSVTAGSTAAARRAGR